MQVFFLLDDYASWLAQRESRIADLLDLCIEETGEGIRLHLAVVESKYVAAEAADLGHGAGADGLSHSSVSAIAINKGNLRLQCRADDRECPRPARDAVEKRGT